MKKLGLLVATMAMVGMGASANAATAAKKAPIKKPEIKKYDPLLKCDSFEFRIRGGGFQPVIGVFEIKGEGKVDRHGREYVGRYHCTDLDSNKKVDVLAKVVMGSDRGLAPRISVGYFELEGKSDMNFRGKARDLNQHYVSGGAQIAWGLGLRLQTMVIDNDELSLVLRLKPLVGAGFSAGFTSVNITPMRYAEPKRLTDID